MLKLAGRYYRTIPMDDPQYVTETLELDPRKTVLIGMHCWNIGCEDGPDMDRMYWVGMGFPHTTVEAGRIMREHIRPAIGCRPAGGSHRLPRRGRVHCAPAPGGPGGR